MKLKVFAGFTLTLFLLITVFSAIPVKSDPGTIKIGVIGPMPWIQGQGMKEGTEIALDMLDGVFDGVDGTILGQEVELVFADTLRGKPDPDAETGRAAALELMAAGCDFVIGGFRTEALLSAREVVMDYKKIWTIAGAATNELIDCANRYNYPLVTPPNPCGACVRCDYARYKYMFRATPINSTVLVTSIATHLQKELLGYWLWVGYTLGDCMGYPAYYTDTDASYNVTAGDTRATPVCKCADGSGTFLMPGIVAPGDCDIGAPLMKVPVYGKLTKLYGRDLGQTYNDGIGHTYPVMQVQVAVITEALVWADVIDLMLSYSAIYPAIMGPFAHVNYHARISPVATDVSGEIAGALAQNCHVIIHVISGPAGRAFASQWKDASGDGVGQLRAIAIGIDVPGQEIPAHWDLTTGKAETEAFLVTSGQRTPLTPGVVNFYDQTVSRYGHAPIYTSYGSYDALIGLKKRLETDVDSWASLGYTAADLADQAKYDDIVPVLEGLYRPDALVGKFKYTEHHDVLSTQLDENWGDASAPGYVRALQGQWQKDPLTGEGRLEIVYPYAGWAATFAKKFIIPEYMYESTTGVPLGEVDLNVDGTVDVTGDVAQVQAAYLAVAGDSAWNRVCDMDGNYLIDVKDVARVAWDIGETQTLPLPD